MLSEDYSELAILSLTTLCSNTGDAYPANVNRLLPLAARQRIPSQGYPPVT